MAAVQAWQNNTREDANCLPMSMLRYFKEKKTHYNTMYMEQPTGLECLQTLAVSGCHFSPLFSHILTLKTAKNC